VAHFFGGQKGIAVHVKHFKTNCKHEEKKQLWKPLIKFDIKSKQQTNKRPLHFWRSAVGPLHAAEMPQAISLKSICWSLFSSKALKMPGHTDSGAGGLSRGIRVSWSKRPVPDWPFSVQYRFSNSIMSFSTTETKHLHSASILFSHGIFHYH